ncbi:MAG: hypothetical protein CVV41_04590 [Candidatus Riflebacteria bacterium HGW-Riflebacteria-1]|jgi:hypothetical protein|nr:MAG: hypothetical protein CVV41_04590 [Candidatus Riflebacteria bacterium HGW-Riflebacteria-1]
MRSRITIFILGLALLATMAITGCSLFGDDDDDNAYDPGTKITGSISTTGGGSLRAQGAPTSATLTFSYIDDNGQLVSIPFVTGNTVTFTGTTAIYDFRVIIPAAALLRRNFVLTATPDFGDPIKGVIPFDPATEMDFKVDAPITPDDAGPVAFVIAATKEGIPNVALGDVLSIYAPVDLKAMINLDGTLKPDMTTLVTQFKTRETAIQTAMTGEFAAQATLMKQLMDYSAQLARNPEYIGFANREKFRAAMEAKAKELGLPTDAYNAYDATTTDVWADLPKPPSAEATEFENYGGAREQTRELENLGLALQYFAGLYTDKATEINAIRTRFLTAATTSFTQTMAGTPPAMGGQGHPFMILDEAREIIFAKLWNEAKTKILIQQSEMGTMQLEMAAIIEHKAELYAKVVVKINTHYASLSGAPTDAAQKTIFINHLATLASIPMMSNQQQPGDQQPGDQQPGDQQPGDQQPGDQQPGDQQPGDQQPGDQQPGDQQPGDQQPGDQQPGGPGVPVPPGALR